MEHRLNLRKRIHLGYVAPLTLMIGVAIAVYWSTQTLQRLSADAIEASRVVGLGKEVHVSVAQYQRDARGYLLVQDEGAKQAVRSSLTAFEANRRRLEEAVTDPEQRNTLARLGPVLDQLTRAGQSYLDLLDKGEVGKALQTFRSAKLTELIGKVDGLIDEFEAQQLELLARKEAGLQHAIRDLILVTVGATLAALVLALGIGQWLAARISGAISESVLQLSASSTEIAATVDEHERTVTQQVAAVSQVSATVEELGASARQSAGQAESSAAAALQALGLTQDGTRAANQAAQSTAEMKEKIDSLARQILSLSEQAGQIGAIAKLVSELASETNMLSLNAAVEAARAGEHGKGFAVVAAEIRKLAVQSKKSAERADALVAEIQKATNRAVMVTEDGSRSADQVMATAGEVADAFDAIASAANNVSENAQQVLLNSKQQAAALGQVTDAMQSLAGGSRQMAAGTEQTKIGVENLKQVALALKAMV